LAPLLARHLAAAPAGDAGGGGVLGDPDLLRLPAHLRPHRRRAGELDAPHRHLRLPDRRRLGPARRGRGALALHVSGALCGGVGAVALPETHGERLVLIERKWKKWVFFYLPMAAFIVFTLFPFYWMAITAFRPDSELYATWRQPNS